MVFVLDNYDSFTYNLVQYMGELGAEMVIRRNDELTPAEVEALRSSGFAAAAPPTPTHKLPTTLPQLSSLFGKPFLS